MKKTTKRAKPIKKTKDDRYKDCDIMVVGDVMLDTWTEAEPVRLSSESMSPVYNLVKSSHSGVSLGGAGHVAKRLQHLLLSGQNASAAVVLAASAMSLMSLPNFAGYVPYFWGLLGYSDGFFLPLQATTPQTFDIKTRLVDSITGAVASRVDIGADLLIQRGGNHDTAVDKLAANYKLDPSIIVIVDYAKGAVTQTMYDSLRKQFPNAQFVLALKPPGDRMDPIDVQKALGTARLIVVNEAEARGLRLSDSYIATHSAELVITCGSRGMLTRAGRIHSAVPAARCVVGAGDMVLAALVYGLNETGRDEQLNRYWYQFAQAAAGELVTAQKSWQATIPSVTVHAAAACAYGYSARYMSLEAAKELVRYMRDPAASQRPVGDKIVFTNGCFDGLHAGHRMTLEHAVVHGRLIVAVNSDESVQKLKGKSRPITLFGERVRAIAAIRGIDAVVKLDDNLEQLLEAIQPDIIVKGGDYKKKTDVVGHDFKLKNGNNVEVLLTPHVEGVSTTRNIEKAKIRKGKE